MNAGPDGLTPRQREVLAFYRERAAAGVSPTVREVAERFGFSNNAVMGHVERLARKGFLDRDPGKARSVTLRAVPSAWVKAADRLPETPGVYLVCLQPVGVCDPRDLANYRPQSGWSCSEIPVHHKVLYWAPIPAPPEGLPR